MQYPTVNDCTRTYDIRTGSGKEYCIVCKSQGLSDASAKRGTRVSAIRISSYVHACRHGMPHVSYLTKAEASGTKIEIKRYSSVDCLLLE